MKISRYLFLTSICFLSFAFAGGPPGGGGLGFGGGSPSGGLGFNDGPPDGNQPQVNTVVVDPTNQQDHSNDHETTATAFAPLEGALFTGIAKGDIFLSLKGVFLRMLQVYWQLDSTGSQPSAGSKGGFGNSQEVSIIDYGGPTTLDAALPNIQGNYSALAFSSGSYALSVLSLIKDFFLQYVKGRTKQLDIHFYASKSANDFINYKNPPSGDSSYTGNLATLNKDWEDLAADVVSAYTKMMPSGADSDFLKQLKNNYEAILYDCAFQRDTALCDWIYNLLEEVEKDHNPLAVAQNKFDFQHVPDVQALSMYGAVFSQALNGLINPSIGGNATARIRDIVIGKYILFVEVPPSGKLSPNTFTDPDQFSHAVLADVSTLLASIGAFISDVELKRAELFSIGKQAPAVVPQNEPEFGHMSDVVLMQTYIPRITTLSENILENLQLAGLPIPSNTTTDATGKITFNSDALEFGEVSSVILDYANYQDFLIPAGSTKEQSLKGITQSVYNYMDVLCSRGDLPGKVVLLQTTNTTTENLSSDQVEQAAMQLMRMFDNAGLTLANNVKKNPDGTFSFSSTVINGSTITLTYSQNASGLADVQSYLQDVTAEVTYTATENGQTQTKTIGKSFAAQYTTSTIGDKVNISLVMDPIEVPELNYKIQFTYEKDDTQEALGPIPNIFNSLIFQDTYKLLSFLQERASNVIDVFNFSANNQELWQMPSGGSYWDALSSTNSSANAQFSVQAAQQQALSDATSSQAQTMVQNAATQTAQTQANLKQPSTTTTVKLTQKTLDQDDDNATNAATQIYNSLYISAQGAALASTYYYNINNGFEGEIYKNRQGSLSTVLNDWASAIKNYGDAQQAQNAIGSNVPSSSKAALAPSNDYKAAQNSFQSAANVFQLMGASSLALYSNKLAAQCGVIAYETEIQNYVAYYKQYFSAYITYALKTPTKDISSDGATFQQYMDEIFGYFSVMLNNAITSYEQELSFFFSLLTNKQEEANASNLSEDQEAVAQLQAAIQVFQNVKSAFDSLFTDGKESYEEVWKDPSGTTEGGADAALSMMAKASQDDIIQWLLSANDKYGQAQIYFQEVDTLFASAAQQKQNYLKDYAPLQELLGTSSVTLSFSTFFYLHQARLYTTIANTLEQKNLPISAFLYSYAIALYGQAGYPDQAQAVQDILTATGLTSEDLMTLASDKNSQLTTALKQQQTLLDTIQEAQENNAAAQAQTQSTQTKGSSTSATTGGAASPASTTAIPVVSAAQITADQQQQLTLGKQIQELFEEVLTCYFTAYQLAKTDDEKSKAADAYLKIVSSTLNTNQKPLPTVAPTAPVSSTSGTNQTTADASAGTKNTLGNAPTTAVPGYVEWLQDNQDVVYFPGLYAAVNYYKAYLIANKQGASDASGYLYEAEALLYQFYDEQSNTYTLAKFDPDADLTEDEFQTKLGYFNLLTKARTMQNSAHNRINEYVYMLYPEEIKKDEQQSATTTAAAESSITRLMWKTPFPGLVKMLGDLFIKGADIKLREIQTNFATGKGYTSEIDQDFTDIIARYDLAGQQYALANDQDDYAKIKKGITNTLAYQAYSQIIPAYHILLPGVELASDTAADPSPKDLIDIIPQDLCTSGVKSMDDSAVEYIKNASASGGKPSLYLFRYTREAIPDDIVTNNSISETTGQEDLITNVAVPLYEQFLTKTAGTSSSSAELQPYIDEYQSQLTYMTKNPVSTCGQSLTTSLKVKKVLVPVDATGKPIDSNSEANDQVKISNKAVYFLEIFNRPIPALPRFKGEVNCAYNLYNNILPLYGQGTVPVKFQGRSLTPSRNPAGQHLVKQAMFNSYLVGALPYKAKIQPFLDVLSGTTDAQNQDPNTTLFKQAVAAYQSLNTATEAEQSTLSIKPYGNLYEFIQDAFENFLGIYGALATFVQTFSDSQAQAELNALQADAYLNWIKINRNFLLGNPNSADFSHYINPLLNFEAQVEHYASTLQDTGKTVMYSTQPIMEACMLIAEAFATAGDQLTNLTKQPDTTTYSGKKFPNPDASKVFPIVPDMSSLGKTNFVNEQAQETTTTTATTTTKTATTGAAPIVSSESSSSNISAMPKIATTVADANKKPPSLATTVENYATWYQWENAHTYYTTASSHYTKFISQYMSDLGVPDIATIPTEKDMPGTVSSPTSEQEQYDFIYKMRLGVYQRTVEALWNLSVRYLALFGYNAYDQLQCIVEQNYSGSPDFKSLVTSSDRGFHWLNITATPKAHPKDKLDIREGNYWKLQKVMSQDTYTTLTTPLPPGKKTKASVQSPAASSLYNQSQLNAMLEDEATIDTTAGFPKSLYPAEGWYPQVNYDGGYYTAPEVPTNATANASKQALVPFNFLPQTGASASYQGVATYLKPSFQEILRNGLVGSEVSNFNSFLSGSGAGSSSNGASAYSIMHDTVLNAVYYFMTLTSLLGSITSKPGPPPSTAAESKVTLAEVIYTEQIVNYLLKEPGFAPAGVANDTFPPTGPAPYIYIQSSTKSSSGKTTARFNPLSVFSKATNNGWVPLSLANVSQIYPHTLKYWASLPQFGPSLIDAYYKNKLLYPVLSHWASGLMYMAREFYAGTYLPGQSGTEVQSSINTAIDNLKNQKYVQAKSYIG